MANNRRVRTHIQRQSPSDALRNPAHAAGHVHSPKNDTDENSASALPDQDLSSQLLKLQGQIGNQAVQRLVATRRHAKNADPSIQRTFTQPSNVSFGDPPPYSGLKRTATELDANLFKGYTDLTKPGGELATGLTYYDVPTKKYQPETLVSTEVQNRWSMDAADNVAITEAGQNATAQALEKKKTELRSETVEYFVLDSIRRQIAESVGRKVKRSENEKLVNKRRKLAKEALQEGQKKIDDKGDKATELDQFGKRALKAAENDVDQQDKIAKGISTELAYEVAKAEIDETHPLIKEFTQGKKKAEYISRIVKGAKSQIKVVYGAKLGGKLETLDKQRATAATLRQEIDGNPKMWDMTKRKYGKKLETLGDEVRQANYQAGLVAKITDLDKSLKTDVTTKTKAEIDSLKFNVANDAINKFNGGFFSDPMLFERYRLKMRAFNTTGRALVSDNNKDIKTKDVLGKDVTKKTDDITKVAKEKAVQQTIEGSMNSSLRKIGWLLSKVAPLPGDKGKMEVILKVPVGHSAGYLGFRFTGQFEHGDTDVRKEIEKGKGLQPQNASDPFKVRCELAFIGGVKVPFVFDAGGELGLTYFEAESDRGAERVMDLVSFGYFRRFKESRLIPNSAINFMWGMGGKSAQDGESSSEAKSEEAKAWGKAMQKSFSGKEYVETGFFAGGTAEAQMTDIATFKGSLKALSGKRYTQQTMDALTKAKTNDQGNVETSELGGLINRDRNIGRNISGAELAAEFAVGPFSMGGKTKLYWLEKQTKAIDTKIETARQAVQSNKNKIENGRKNGLDNAIIKRFEADLKTSEDALKKLEEQRQLLARQVFSFDLEFSGQSKASSSMIFGGPDAMAAAIMNYVATLGTQVRTHIIAMKDTYGQRKSQKEMATADIFENASQGLEGFLNGAGKIDPKKATFGKDWATNHDTAMTSSKGTKDMLNQRIGSGNLRDQITNRDHSTYLKDGAPKSAWDKVNETQMKGGGGLKLLFKFGIKRDLSALDTDKTKYPIKIELSLEGAKGMTIGGQGVSASVEKTRRLFRIGGAMDKTGTWALQSM